MHSTLYGSILWKNKKKKFEKNFYGISKNAVKNQNFSKYFGQFWKIGRRFPYVAGTLHEIGSSSYIFFRCFVWIKLSTKKYVKWAENFRKDLKLFVDLREMLEIGLRFIYMLRIDLGTTKVQI